MLGGRLGDRVGMREEVMKKACSLAMKAHGSSGPGNPFLQEKILGSSSSPSVTLFSFPGSWSVDDWFSGELLPFGETKVDLCLFPSLRSIGNDEVAMVNEAFLRRFESVLQSKTFANEVKKAEKERRQMVFTGHSSGGPTAILATLWFLEEYIRSNTSHIAPLCVTFGSPLVGDRIFPHALRRENWDSYFIHFVTRHDIVPRLMLAPLSSTQQELGPVLYFFNPKSAFFGHESVATPREASTLFIAVMRSASSVASHAACNLMGCSNSLLETVTGFIELSPYRPFGTFVFCTGNGKLDDHLTEIPLSSGGSVVGEIATVNEALNDLGLSTRGRLCLRAAGELQKQKQRNQDKINSNKKEIEMKLDSIRKYQTEREFRKVGYYDAFKLQNDLGDFHANVKRLELAGMWDEIIEMLKRYELPDEFEGWKEWIKLGTEFRRLVEPLDIANYYRHLKNDDTGPYLIKARPKRYRYTQRWREHAERMVQGSSNESCFWATVEELRSTNKSFEEMKEKILQLERDVLKWIQHGEIGNDVFLGESTVAKWWKMLPYQHRKESCLAVYLSN